MAYYYVDFNDATRQKLSALLGSLIFQLCAKQDSLSGLEALYDECNEGRSRPDEDQLVQVFFKILDSEELTYIILDGLDECPLESQTSRLGKLVLAQIGDAPGRYNFLFTSRKEADIEEYMKQISEKTDLKDIRIQMKQVDADIRIHVQQFISGDRRISSWSPAVRKEIEDAPLKGSQGM